MSYNQLNRTANTAEPNPGEYAVSEAFNRAGRAIEDCVIATRNLEDRINPILSRPNDDKAPQGVDPSYGVPMADQIVLQAQTLENLARHLNTLFSRVQL